MTFEIQLWQFIIGVVVIVFGAGGLNYYANKAALNGFKMFTIEKLNSIEKKLDRIEDKVGDHGEEIAAIKSSYHRK